MEERTLKQHNWAEAISIIFLKVVIYIINFGVYAGVYNIKLIQMVLTLLLVQGFFFKEKNEDDVKQFITVIWGITLIVMFFTRPGITYGEGKTKASIDGFTNIENAEIKAINSLDYKEDKAIARAYLYMGEKNSEKYYIQVHPDSGKVVAKQPGKDKYLDSLFEK